MEKQVIIDLSKDDSDEIPNVTDFSASSDIHMEKKVIIEMSKDDSDEIPNLTDFSASRKSLTQILRTNILLLPNHPNMQSQTPLHNPNQLNLEGRKSVQRF